MKRDWLELTFNVLLGVLGLGLLTLIVQTFG
ncbi:hypothetical protein QO006_003168 [Deinococcus enclensis]|jgi:hypothetical protein|uniref:Uncharacterized protein n=1 Tax=Deinococcus enclensis TaxID=1049582 RepID=A0ABT9MGK4_9DEIO|nr:hypothetical protein [Deinococcus enclensis]